MSGRVDLARDHLVGPPDAPLTLVEYGDYECPYCAQAHVELKNVLRHFQGQLAFVYRNFPLTKIHPRAAEAAEAAEAAGAQGRFWEMHDLLYENRDHLEHEHLLGYARTLSLDMRAFSLALEHHTYLPRVRADFITGARSGVNGTPTFFIDGHRHEGTWDASSLILALQRERSAVLGHGV
jgi:protein-disulfide isomerase